MITKRQIKLIRSLALKRNRIKHQLFVVEGEKSVKELLSSDYEIDILFATNKWIKNNLAVNAMAVTNSELSRISNQKTPNEVLAIVKIKNHEIVSDKGGVTLVLDNINDPGNMGTIIRTCDWFNVQSIICSCETVDMYNPKVVQSAMGSLFRVAIIYTNLTEYLRHVNTPIYGACLEGQNIKDAILNRNLHLVVGNEANGITKDVLNLITSSLHIKRIGKAESLNVAVATSILLNKICS